MNREIKFRGRSLETGEWVYGDLVVYRNCGNVHFINGIAVDEKTVGQYIGLNDKKITEIYDDDIVKYLDGEYSFTGAVEWDGWQYYISGIEPCDSFDFADFTDTNTNIADIEVIGNIYENKDLLEVE